MPKIEDSCIHKGAAYALTILLRYPEASGHTCTNKNWDKKSTAGTDRPCKVSFLLDLDPLGQDVEVSLVVDTH